MAFVNPEWLGFSIFTSLILDEDSPSRTWRRSLSRWVHCDYTVANFSTGDRMRKPDLNYVEDNAGGPDVTVGFLPKLDKVALLLRDAKLTIDMFENDMQLAVEDCEAIASYIREIMLENSYISMAHNPKILRAFLQKGGRLQLFLTSVMDWRSFEKG